MNSYTWDRANRLLSMGGVDYQYDGEGRRVQQTVSSVVTKYLLDIQPGLAVVLSQTEGSAVTRFVHAPRGIHARQDASNDWHWTVQDGLGTVRVETDNSVGVEGSQNLDPFGNLAGSVNGTIGTPYGFTGELVDGSGLLDLRARRYNAGAGVFASLDPLGMVNGGAGELIFHNRYSYVNGNPINLIDPSGLLGELPSHFASCVTGTTSSGLCCGYDVSTWFLEELNIHARFVETEIAYPRNLPQVVGIPILGPIIEKFTVDELTVLSAFRLYARAIPHKWMRFDVIDFVPNSNCPSNSQCSRGVTLCGKCIDRSELGNIMFGYAGGKLALNQDVLWAVAKAVGALKGRAEEVTAGIGIYLSGQPINSVQDLCQKIAGASGAFPNGTRWDWNFANADQKPDISQCNPCAFSLPSYYPHTVPSIDPTLAGTSVWADSSLGLADPNANPNAEFYTTQIPSIGYLSPELCSDLDTPVAGCGVGAP